MQTRRHSYKRDAVLQALMKTKLHPSAEQLYTWLKPEFSDLSLATVYRNLNILRDDGVINSVGVVNGEERFDADTSPHPHFICTCCGSVTDVEAKIDLTGQISELKKDGIEIAGCSVAFYGKCKQCCGASR
ncbi:MAG: transcriptional repressor [Oscillospiraceae bacterium]|nr:transcriptional repressor [Oscillospiraceae bacterium]